MSWELSDDIAEYRRRRNAALYVGVPLGLLLGGFLLKDCSEGPWWLLVITCSPFLLAGAAAAFLLRPIRAGALGTRAHNSPPRPLRPGNPMTPRSRYLALSGGALFVLALAACLGLSFLAPHNELTAQLGDLAPLMIFFSCGLLWLGLWAVTSWLEMDVDSLRMLRHRVILGLQLSHPEPAGRIRNLAVCISGDGLTVSTYAIFAFTDSGACVQVSEQGELAQLQFEAGRLADRLMVPLLVGVERYNSTRLNRLLLTAAQTTPLPVRKDWKPVQAGPEELAARSVLPPID